MSLNQIIFVVFCFLSIPTLSSQGYIDSLEAQLAISKESAKASILNQLSTAHSKDASDKAVQYANRALSLSQKHQDRKNEALALQNLCLGYLYNDIYDKALENGLAALEIFEALGDPRDKAYILSTLGWLYYDIQNADLALNYHQKVLEIYQSLEDADNIAMSYNSLGLIYSMKKEYEKALSYYLLSLEIAEKGEDKSRLAAIHNNLGMTYAALKSYQLAQKHLQNALQLMEETASILGIAEVWNQLGATYTGMEQFDKAEECLLKAQTYIEQSTSKTALEKLVDNYEFSANLFSAKEEYQKAFIAYKEYSSLRNSIFSEDQKSRLSEMRLLYETEKKESEIQLLESQKNIDRLVRNSSVAGFILFIIIGYLIYNSLRSKHQQAKQAKDRLEDQLNFKSKELTTFALHIAQRNEILNKMVDSLTQIQKNADADTSKNLRTLIGEIHQSQQVNQHIEDFHINVEKTYENFFYHLNQSFPGLTQNEKRLSAQVRLNLSNKNIAALNNISVKSVEMARYRLRKRFELDTKDSLTEFLKKF